jgi:dTDP-glucose 4,6-dehydratase
VGSADAVTIADLARRVVSVIAPAASIRMARQPKPGAPALRYVPATERAEKELGLRSWIPLEEAIGRTKAWHQEIRNK